ncbi:MAG: AAA family ATPase [Acidimicrobiales bacterium]
MSRASGFLSNGKVRIKWNSGESQQTSLRDVPDQDEEPGVHYLSQQFVERLCSPEGIDDELIAEVEKVVFAAHEPSSRLGTTSFRELLDAKTGDQREQRQYLRDRLDRISEEVLVQREMKRTLAAKDKRRKQITTERDGAVKQRGGIVGAGQKERSEYYTRLREAIDARKRAIQDVARVKQSIEHLRAEVVRYESAVFPDLVSNLRDKFATTGFADDDWDEFAIGFKGRPRVVIERHLEGADKLIAAHRLGNRDVNVGLATTAEVLATAPLELLEKAFAQVSKEIGVDQAQTRKLKQLNDRIAVLEVELKKLDEEIERDKGADERLRGLSAERADRYEEFFDLLVAEQGRLAALYAPLEKHLSNASESVRRLALVVVRNVDTEAWANRGEELLDLRKSGKFQGRGSLGKFARKRLLPAWASGTAEEVAQAMSNFRAEFDEALLKQSRANLGDPDYAEWTLDVGRWLYSTDHIVITYSFEYDRVPLSQLSPGTRGIVLLLLYLALDLDDHRPLIIDQPEENLDPLSVFSELVELFKETRNRRQVVMVTHNANLVVNTDVDQVVVANSQRDSVDRPPNFRYVSGGLESPEIRGHVCDILEGGERAFRERARRLRVRY